LVCQVNCGDPLASFACSTRPQEFSGATIDSKRASIRSALDEATDVAGCSGHVTVLNRDLAITDGNTAHLTQFVGHAALRALLVEHFGGHAAVPVCASEQTAVGPVDIVAM
jgi:hypothetical protein